jgi:3-oxoacyl-(acyl-carrier-protein) synthase
MNVRAVITGLGAISPAGIGVDRLWHAVRDAVPSGGRIKTFDTANNMSHIAAAVPDFDPLTCGIDPCDVERLDRVCLFSILASRMGIKDAGIEINDPTRIGVVMGTAIGGVAFMERTFNQASIPNGGAKPHVVAVRDEAMDPNVYGAFMPHSVSTEVARDLKVCGVCSTVSTGCTAGIDAIGTAADLIASGYADVIITGGADAPITPIVLTAFDNINCLTRRNHEPTHASRPFDRERDGFLLAEGCGVLVLESLEHARKRSAHIYGAIIGFASLSNAYHMTSLPADGVVLASTLSLALERAGINASDVEYINAHGSSTKQNDRNETAAFKLAFGPAAPGIPISGTKSVIGHSLGAASALETVVCTKAMQENVIPPTANYEIPDPECDLDYVPNTARDCRIRITECNASGFSGIHSSILLSREVR